MISPSLASPPPFGFEIYAPAHTVSEFCQDDAGLVKVTGVLKAVNVSKIYLETYRSGHRVEESILITARDRLRAAGFEVATGITTTPGGGQGVASNGNSYFFNYESQETRDLLKSLFEFMATHFDEIMVDDFFLTDDTSEVSVGAKKDRTWSEYRLALMTEVAEKWAVGPARKINPKVIVTLKYPQ